MTSRTAGRHAAPHRIITRRKPNRRPEATRYYPTDGEVSALAYLADIGR
jgi:hypothetical protein